MPKQILLFQFRLNPVLQQLEKEAWEDKIQQKIEAINALETDCRNINIQDYDCFLFGGSGDVDCTIKTPLLEKAKTNTKHIIKQIIEQDKPSLFICFGLHLLADFHECSFHDRAAQKELGRIEITVTDAGKRDPLFQNIPHTFHSHAFHFDAVKELPQNGVLLATNKTCPIQAFKLKNNIYALQFHPELNKDDIEKRKQYNKSYFPPGCVYGESTDAEQILKNFLGTLTFD